jgi:hypothetical protein
MLQKRKIPYLVSRASRGEGLRASKNPALTASDSVNFRRSRLENVVGWLQPGQSHSKGVAADGKKRFPKVVQPSGSRLNVCQGRNSTAALHQVGGLGYSNEREDRD